VLAITKTRDGYLWLATYEGAARFDGARFTLFNASTTPGIGNSFVNALLETRDGHLWLATFGGAGSLSSRAETASRAISRVACSKTAPAQEIVHEAPVRDHRPERYDDGAGRRARRGRRRAWSS
jgi:ligand-binding sensor domain-containing protein